MNKEALIQRIQELEAAKARSLAAERQNHDNACAQEGAIQQTRWMIDQLDKAAALAEQSEPGKETARRLEIAKQEAAG